MRKMIADDVKVQCIVTSPPYWGLRDYDVDGQLGLERTWIRHVARMRSVFRLARTLLNDDGVLWLNYGDSYYSPRVSGGDTGSTSTINGKGTQNAYKDAQRAKYSAGQFTNQGTAISGPNRRRQLGLKNKDLVGMPWMVALALRFDGWWLRSDVVWWKDNPMPESVQDRPTKAHEYIFMMSKSQTYYSDFASIREPVSEGTHRRLSQKVEEQIGSKRANGGTRTDRTMKAVARKQAYPTGWAEDTAEKQNKKGRYQNNGVGFGHGYDKNVKPRVKDNLSMDSPLSVMPDDRNIRTVWKFPTQGFQGQHFATFPQELAKRCILASTKPGDVVFDPFMGSGTTAQVALSLGRRFIGCELNPESAALFDQYRPTTLGLPL